MPPTICRPSVGGGQRLDFCRVCDKTLTRGATDEAGLCNWCLYAPHVWAAMVEIGRIVQTYVTQKLAPPRVDDIQKYWSEPPPTTSARCSWWEDRIENGWIGNRRIRIMGYDEAASYFGVYIYEYNKILFPLLEEKRHLKRIGVIEERVSIDDL